MSTHTQIHAAKGNIRKAKRMWEDINTHGTVGTLAMATVGAVIFLGVAGMIKRTQA